MMNGECLCNSAGHKVAWLLQLLVVLSTDALYITRIRFDVAL